MLPEVQKCYSIDDTEAGLAQSVFTISFMIFSPVIGYFGDRFDRRPILGVGIFVWCCAVIGSTAVPCDGVTRPDYKKFFRLEIWNYVGRKCEFPSDGNSCNQAGLISRFRSRFIYYSGTWATAYIYHVNCSVNTVRLFQSNVRLRCLSRSILFSQTSL